MLEQMSKTKKIVWISTVFLAMSIPLSFAFYDSGRSLHLLIIIALILSLFSMLHTDKREIEVN
jgi:hypothetical protein